MVFCNDNWYIAYYPDLFASEKHRFELLVSKGAFSNLTSGHEVQCGCGNVTSVDSSNHSLYITELGFMTQLNMILGLLFLAFIMYRSCSRNYVDWYRLIFLYIIGTLAVPLSLGLGPQCAGFNRVAGFGILFHNLTEWFLVGRLWFGNESFKHSSTGTLFIVMYFWIILALLSFLPLVPLFLILMIQGAFLDWTLVSTFIVCGTSMQTKKYGNYFWYGFGAALTHILSIQPLFFEFSLSKAVLAAPTIVFLIPTFILYVWWAAADSDEPITFIAPSVRTDNDVKNIENELNVMISKKDYKNSSQVDDDDQSRDEKDKKRSSISQVLEYGLANIDGRKTFWIVVGCSLIICIGNGLLVFFAPCYVDVHSFVC